MEQLLTFIGNHPLLVGAFAVVLAALIATESARFVRRWKELEVNEAILLINRRDPMIVDVSNSADFAKGHILNAENLPPSRIEAGNQKLMKAVSRPVLVYCKNGQVSPQIATRLTKMGFEEVYLLRGGLAQWVSEQQPITRGKRAAGGGDRSGRGRKDGKRKSKDKSNKSDKRDDAKLEAPVAEQSTGDGVTAEADPEIKSDINPETNEPQTNRNQNG